MRAISSALAAATRAGNATPDLRVELIDWSAHYASVFTGGPQGRTSAALAFDGALVQAYTDGAGHVYARRVVDPTQSSWGVWTAVVSSASSSGVVCLCNAGDRMRVLFQDSGTTRIGYCDSGDNGVTWTAAVYPFDPGAAAGGIACDGTAAQIFVLYAHAANAYRVGLWTYAGGWTGVDWGLGDSYSGSGLAVLNLASAGYVVAVCLEATSASGTAVLVATYGVGGGGWAGLRTIVPGDLAAGVFASDPHLASYDGLDHLSYALVDSGSISGLASTRVAVLHSLDGVHWSDPLEDGGSYSHGAVALKHASGYLLAAADGAARAVVYSGSATQYRDCTADLAHLEIDQVDGHAARITVTLLNDVGQYSTLACLRRNARLRISLGYAGVGVVYSHVGYVETWTMERAADVSQVVIVADDGRGWLDRGARSALVYANLTVGDLTRELLARAGLLQVSVPATAQFSQTVGLFHVVAGQTWTLALTRLSGLYGYDVALRAQADGTDLAVVVEKSPSDAVAWAYGDEVDQLHVERSGDRANHVLVFGARQPAGSPDIVGEAWDFSDVADVGQERYRQVVDALVPTAGAAAIRAGLEMNREKRAALAGEVTAALNPGLELWDVVSVTDGVVGSASGRVRSLRHSYDAGRALYDLVIGLEGA